MYELRSTAKRYQNPEVFELLAMEYAVGSLHGRSRKRFEVLMDTHFYLRATVDAYSLKFAHLVELVPDKEPSDLVWKNIESHIKKSVEKPVEQLQEEKTSWWQNVFFKQGFGMAAMALIVSMVYFYDPMTDGDSAVNAYSAAMEYDMNGQAIATTKIQKSDMKLTIDIMKPMAFKNGMELTLWCHPKKGGMPMKMGTISETGVTELIISENEWENLAGVGSLLVSVEEEGNASLTRPSGRIILKGQLSSIE